MPQKRQNFADGDKIVLAIYLKFYPLLCDCLERIDAALADRKWVDGERAARLAEVVARAAAAGEKVDWCLFYRANSLSYSYDLDALKRELIELDDGWVKFDTEFFAGRQLSPSEKQVWRAKIRQLTDDGILIRSGRWLRLSDEGKEAAIPLAAAAMVAADDESGSDR